MRTPPTAPRSVTRASIYTRISRDSEGDRLGVTRQLESCRALCERNEWTVSPAHIFEDDDKSAYSGKRRSDYEAMLDAVKDGEIDVIVAWHPDRLHRSPKELEHFIELLEVSNVTVATVTAGDRDFATPDGRLHARIEGALARRESEHKSVRLKSKHKELAEGGKMSGGNRPFGYEVVKRLGDRPGTLKVNHTEAALIREATKRVLAGEGLVSICRDWNEKDITTTQGARWRATTLKRMLTTGPAGGQRFHGGEITAKAVWPAIIPEKQWDQLRAILLDPARKRTRAPRSYLLSPSMIRCGKCGAGLVARPHYNAAGEAVPSYGCSVRHGGCGKLTIRADGTERFVTDQALGELTHGSRLERRIAGDGDSDGEDDELRDQITRLEASLEEAAALYFREHQISQGEYLAARTALMSDLDAARSALAQTVRRDSASGILSGVNPDKIRGEWDSYSLDRRRALIKAVIVEVKVGPARPGNRFDARRLTPEGGGGIVWR